MKLKKVIETTEGLHEAIAALYEKKEDGKFHLMLEDDDAEPLRRAKEHEVGLRQLAERDLGAARAELATAQSKIADLERAQSQSTQELRTDAENRIRQLTEAHNTEKKVLEGTIKKVFVGDVAHRIAGEIAIDEGAAELLSDSIARRLSVEIVAGQPVTRVLNADGSASTMNPDELKAEYLQMKKFAGILRASDASGGGAHGGGGGGGAPANKKPFKEWGDAERNALLKENPAEFNRLVAEEKAANSP